MADFAQNRKARHDYEILEEFDGGLVLTGQEVKSIREGGAKLDGAYIKVFQGELWLMSAHIRPYSKASRLVGYNPDARRKVLVRQRELDYLAQKTQQKGLTLVPLSFYPASRRIKLRFALARGKQTPDKRVALKKRDLERQLRRGEE